MGGREPMFPVAVIVAVVAGLALLAALFAGARGLAAHRAGRVVLLIGVVIIPLLLMAGGLSHGVTESSRTRFCLSCHEMQNHGKSLFVDDRHALAAVHYQNRFVDRETVCYSCHKDYALFGDLRAKLNGLRHVWVHYTRGAPETLALYRPYPSSNCLHCHEDARRFLEAAPHKPVMEAITSGATSCLACHGPAHDLDAVKARRFWQAD
jgi:cytochrome c-type protein NapC